MISSLDKANEIAKKVNGRLSEWGVDIKVKGFFVIMIAQVVKELLVEHKKSKKQ